MYLTIKRLLLGIWLLCGLTLSATASPKLHYLVEVGSIAKKILHVQLTLTAPPSEKTVFEIPAWTPGYYQILHYEKNISNVHAQDSAKKFLTLTHPSLRRWEVANPNHSSSVSLEYDVTANDSGYGFFGSSLEPNVGFINGASAFMYPVGYKEVRIALTMKMPPQWNVTTGLDTLSLPSKESPNTYRFQAMNYDELADCPVQFGKYDLFSFNVSKTPFQCVLVGEHKADAPALQKSLITVAKEAEKILGKFPFKRYVFLFHIGGAGFSGGLEHRNSTTIHLWGPIGTGASEGIYPLIAHEFFHAWDVKYIRPVQLGPFDYTKEVRSPSVWFAEGVTDYYAQLLLLRACAFSKEWFLTDMAGRIRSLSGNSARKTVTLEEASQKAWEGGSMGFGGLSYYEKGSILGFYFDLRIRALTDGVKGLDDVLRELDEKYASKNQGYPDGSILTAINNAAGVDLSAEYNSYVRGTDEIDWNQTLKPYGLRYAQRETGFLGISTSPSLSGSTPVTIEDVQKGTSAETMGLQKGDTLLQVNGTKLDAGNYRTALQAMKPGADIRITVKRKAGTLTLTGKLGARPSEVVIESLPNEELQGKEESLRQLLLASPSYYKKE